MKWADPQFVLLKPMIVTESVGGGAICIAILTGGGNKILFRGNEGPQAVPTRPSSRGRFNEGKAFGSGNAFIQNFEF